MTAAFQQDPSPPLPSQPGVDPMGIRLLHLNIAIGSNLVPGIDSREPAVGMMPEALPDPPDPPSGNKN